MTAAADIAALVDEAAHYLPEQAPLHAFVHHNTLHVFEHLPFHDAVVRGADLFGTRAYMEERLFARALESGRITARDIRAVVREDADRWSGVPEPAPSVSWQRFLELRLAHLFDVPERARVDWLLHERDALDAIHPAVPSETAVRLARAGASPGNTLRALWRALEGNAPPLSADRAGVARPRDRLVAAGQPDPDELVHPLVIRLAAAFLDQGIGYWTMPNAERGFLRAVRQLYGLGGGPPDRWLRELPALLRQQDDDALSATDTIAWALDRLGVAPSQRGDVIRETLLSLRGWAGMFHHLEQRPDRAPVRDPRARLTELAAVQLTLDVLATEHVLREAGASSIADVATPPADVPGGVDAALVYEAFVAAQVCGLTAERLGSPRAARAWLSAVARVDVDERGRLLQLAYERRHEVEVLDGLHAHARRAAERDGAPAYQAVFCIDDREESLRRHLEELDPGCETFGYAGFFGVAMAYRADGAVRATPLCPVTVRPRHLIREVPLDEREHAAHTERTRARARLRRSWHVGSRTLARGGLVSAAVGMAAVVPLVGRCLFPRAMEHASLRLLDTEVPATRLLLERGDDEGEVDGYLQGYTVSEMADIVDGLLETAGLAERTSPMVLVIGHGSSSLNNPHEAAHDCGATGGGRGGPNARAFCLMANHPRVRALLAERGKPIPESTWFLAGYHNTCDDSLTYYDEDALPSEHGALAARARDALAAACELDAHERCRRFEDGSSRMSPARALLHARAHAADLGQPRPEYGHATNAVCIVGRRWRTRGLFLDRRAFLVSYDPETDSDGEVLARLLHSVGPVGAGINLEYYFSFVDPSGYGCGTKLPHNVTGLLGVMDGHSSDLRTGLPWQMVEIHEPVRLLTIVEARPELLERLLSESPALTGLVGNGWIRLVASDPSSAELWSFRGGRFVRHRPSVDAIPVVARSADFYSGKRGHLGPATTEASLQAGAS